MGMTHQGGKKRWMALARTRTRLWGLVWEDRREGGREGCMSQWVDEAGRIGGED